MIFSMRPRQQLPQRGLLTFVLGALVSLPPLSITLIAPAIPVLKAEFASSYNETQLIITAFLVTMAISLLFVGILSDRFGRRPIFLGGASLFLISSLIGLYAPSITILIGARIVQGMGAAALMTAGRIIATDIYEAKDASRALSAITAAQSIAPALALAIGGLIVETFGWRATMTVMAVVSGFVLIQSYWLIPETNHNRLSQLRFTGLVAAFHKVMSARLWQLYSLCAGMQIGMFYSMNGYMPYHFTRLGTSAGEFGFYYAAISFGYLCGNLTNRYFGPALSLQKWVLYGSLVGLVPLITMGIADEMSILTPLGLSSLLLMVGFSHGMIVANAIILSMSNMGAHSGSASGIGSASHMLIGAIAGSAIISLGGATSFWICIMATCLMALASLIASLFGMRHKP